MKHVNAKYTYMGIVQIGMDEVNQHNWRAFALRFPLTPPHDLVKSVIKSNEAAFLALHAGAAGFHTTVVAEIDVASYDAFDPESRTSQVRLARVVEARFQEQLAQLLSWRSTDEC